MCSNDFTSLNNKFIWSINELEDDNELLEDDGTKEKEERQHVYSLKKSIKVEWLLNRGC